MSDRDADLRSFLDGTPWADAEPSFLAGDASNRKYLRLTRAATGETAVVMDAPPGKGEDTRPFIRVARYLTGVGLSAPKILAADEGSGFLILEDLSDALFARVIPDTPEREILLYSTATDLLAQLHQHAPPAELEPYSPEMMADMAVLAFDWYLTGATGKNSPARADFHSAVRTALDLHASQTDVLIQRDYHAENLLWLPDRTGVARVGLLDFQDAMLGHRAYDLVSLLQDARRDVTPLIETTMIERYVTSTRADPKQFGTAYQCLGAQRNLRILGVFARLCIRDGKAHYVDLIPRVWDHLQRDLDHPALADVARIARASLPQPAPETLKKLKDKCATAPTP